MYPVWAVIDCGAASILITPRFLKRLSISHQAAHITTLGKNGGVLQHVQQSQSQRNMWITVQYMDYFALVDKARVSNSSGLELESWHRLGSGTAKEPKCPMTSSSKLELHLKQQFFWLCLHAKEPHCCKLRTLSPIKMLSSDCIRQCCIRKICRFGGSFASRPPMFNPSNISGAAVTYHGQVGVFLID